MGRFSDAIVHGLNDGALDGKVQSCVQMEVEKRALGELQLSSYCAWQEEGQFVGSLANCGRALTHLRFENVTGMNR